MDVCTFTFDSELELKKMIANTPKGKRGRFVLRILPPDEKHSVTKFGVKFGANPYEADRLLREALDLKKENDCFDLIGISFHVGSGCFSTESFKLAVEYAGRVATLSRELGNPMSLLDIGGGYMTQKSMKHFEEEAHGSCAALTFQEIAAVLRRSIADVKDCFTNFHVIAEPGRFFASDCMTLAVRVFGRRLIFDYTGVEDADV
jgi:ornithine decarboxylase